MLLKLRDELVPDPNQYGGKPKCGIEHMLVNLWETILTSLEGGENAAILLGIDYEKAFNRKEHAVCIEQLQRLGASQGSISLVRAFLEERSMTIKVDGIRASPVRIQRGSPQGSVLGCLLYCVMTQALTTGIGTAPDQPIYFPQDPPGAETVTLWAPNSGKERPIEAFLYVDDTTLVSLVPMNAANRHITSSVTIKP